MLPITRSLCSLTRKKKVFHFLDKRAFHFLPRAVDLGVRLENAFSPTASTAAFHRPSHTRTHLFYDRHLVMYTPDIALEAAMLPFHFLPVSDTNIRRTPEQLVQILQDSFPHYMPHPPVDLSTPANTEEQILLLLKQGPGALFMKIADADRGIFEVDLRDMAKYPVRKGFVPYGCCLRFTSDKVLSIEREGAEYMPFHPEWNKMVFIFVSSLLVKLIVQVHAVEMHLLRANRDPALVYDELLTPFTFNSLHSTGAAITVLFEKKGFFERLFAFTPEGLRAFALDGWKYSPTFLERYAHFSDACPNVMKNFPYFEDGALLATSVQRFVNNYLTTTNISTADVTTNLMLSVTTRTVNMRDVYQVTDFILSVTYQHEVVGSIQNIQCDPRRSSTKLRRSHTLELMYPDLDTWINQMSPLLVGTTAHNTIKLTDDVSHCYPEGAKRDWYKRFLDDLRENVVPEIARRNLRRKTPYTCADPNKLGMSMSQ